MKAIALLAACFLTAPLSAGDFLLVSEGRPQAEVRVAGGEAGDPLSFAGEELQRYAKAMSGALLPLARVEPLKRPARAWIDELAAPGAPRTVVISADPRVGEGKPAAEPAPGSEDLYLLRVSETRIAIVGATPRAALFGTYDLLERLGCGWCVPGDDAIPRRPTLSLPPLRVDASPAFEYRMMLDFPLMSAAQSVAIVDWIAKNRMNWVHPCANAKGEPTAWFERRDVVVPEIRKRGLHVIFGGHTMHTWVPPERSQEHPEWFALNDGERKPPTLCVTSGDMTAELVRNLERFLDRCPEVEVVDLWHPDGDVFCHCAACTKGLVPAAAGGRVPPGTPLDAVQSAYVISYIEFMNRVAAAVGKSHPRVLVSPLIYGPTDHAMPDGCPAPAENLLLGLAHISRDSYQPLAGEPGSARNQRFLGNDLTWMARSRRHYIYEYYNGWVAPFIYPGAQVIVRDLRLLKELGCQGASSDMYGYSPSNMYAAARALWSPDISWEAAVREFHLRYYGKAGGEMAENWVGLEKGIYGKAGYQSGGALQEPARRAPAGAYFNEVRPRQIELLESLLGRTEDPETKARLERALKPWKVWSAEARFWAFPPFGGPATAAPRGAGVEPPPREWTAKEDHQDMLDQLGIQLLRRGADGMNRNGPNYQNTDESKANPWPDLPDPLRLKDGRRVATSESWWRARRPEIVEDFDREVYGRVPKDVPRVTWRVTSTTEGRNGDIPVVTKALLGRADNSSCPAITVEIQLSLTTPAEAKGPVPVMMELGFNFGGFGAGGPGGPGQAGRKGPLPPGGGAGPGWQERLLKKGWGFAVITPTSVQADSGSGLRKGIIGLANKGRPRKPDDWGALRAWAWGASRALDYLETDKAVDAKQVGIEGISRYGKAALVAMAYDERFAIGFIGSSGEGGAKLHRRNFGELVENLTGSGEYHWMAGNFLKYGGPLNAGDLPVDAHQLIALCAPRPIFISYGAASGPGAEGTWVDQKGSFMAAVAAGPVFRLLGKKDLGTSEFPPLETALTAGELAFRQHGGGHTTGPNWPAFLEFAGRYIKTPAAPAASP